MKDKFDFEQDIYQCWHIIDDLKQLTEMVLDRDASTDDIANVLLGLQTLYDDRFKQLVENFESLLNVDGFSTFVEKDKYKEMEKVGRIVSAEMFEQYYNLKQDIAYQKTIEKPEDYQKEDLKYNEKFLDACITVLKHYTVYDEWPEELKDKKLKDK